MEGTHQTTVNKPTTDPVYNQQILGCMQYRKGVSENTYSMYWRSAYVYSVSLEVEA